MSDKKPHVVQVMVNGFRYVATERNGGIEIRRDGESAGHAKWMNDQLILSSALLPDDVVEALERKLKPRFDAHWDED